MNCKKLLTNKCLAGYVLGAMLCVATVSGCTDGIWHGEVEDSDRAAVEHSFSGQEGRAESGGEHGEGREGNESEDEHGNGSEGSGGEYGIGGEGSGEESEAAMSSPITPLGQSWDGVLGGLDVSARYDTATQSVEITARNTLSQTLCYVQSEPHIKSGTKTVGELGPDKLGDLNSGQEARSSLPVTSEPKLADIAYDGYVVHMEVFDCNGPGPVAHSGGESRDGESATSGGEEGDRSNTLALEETYDAVRGGARLILSYDAPSNSFKGTAENTTAGILSRVRIEVHLSNGVELGPTLPVNMEPGEVLTIDLPATATSFTGWIAHAEVGGGEHGDGSEGASGEHGSNDERRGGD